MNSLERVKAAVFFEDADRVPVIAQVFGYTAVRAGVELADYLCNGELLAHCQLEAYHYFQYDSVFALMDTSVETEAAGSELVYPKNQYPYVKKYAVEKYGLGNLSVPNPLKDGRMPELLKAATILRQKIGDEVLVVGCVLGPMTLATQLMGIEKTIYLAIDEPGEFAGLLEFATEVVIRFGLAQLEAGVHLPIVFDPSSTTTVIPPQFYREFVAPQLKKVFTAFKDKGSIANWIHTAGLVEPILTYYPQIGVDLANIDFCVNPQTALKSLPRTCIDGNIKPLLFVDGSPDQILVESTKLLEIFKERGGFILSSGCEIPLESKADNITAMVRATC